LLLSKARISSIVFSGIFLSSFGMLSFPVLPLHFKFDLFVRNAASQNSGITVFMLLVTTQTTEHFVSGRKKKTSWRDQLLLLRISYKCPYPGETTSIKFLP